MITEAVMIRCSFLACHGGSVKYKRRDMFVFVMVVDH